MSPSHSFLLGITIGFFIGLVFASTMTAVMAYDPCAKYTKEKDTYDRGIVPYETDRSQQFYGEEREQSPYKR